MGVRPDSSGPGELGSIPLYLVDSAKSVEQAPGRITLGVIRLRGWQLDRLDPLPPDLAGHAAYLVRVSYEFDIAPDVPPPTWAEVEFKFPDPEVVVHDALPVRVVKRAADSSYELTAQLRFARRNGAGAPVWPAASPAANIPLPALAPAIQSFGVDGSLVRWRHTGEAPAGRHVGWIVLRVPQAWTEVPVVAAGNYLVETDPGYSLRPASRQDAFTAQLPRPESGTPERVTIPAPGSGGGRRVFVSYAQESAVHKAAVVELCEFLLGKDLDVRYDQQNLHQRRNWDEWTNTEILRADYVLVIASPTYRAAGDGEVPDDRDRRGVVSEYRRLADLLYRRRGEWTGKILPVVLPGRSPDEIPLSFLPGTADYYELSGISDEGAADLLHVLLHDAVT